MMYLRETASTIPNHRVMLTFCCFCEKAERNDLKCKNRYQKTKLVTYAKGFLSCFREDVNLDILRYYWCGRYHTKEQQFRSFSADVIQMGGKRRMLALLATPANIAMWCVPLAPLHLYILV